MRNLIRHILKETTEDILKKYWVNKWDKEKSKGNLPRYDYDLIKKLGLGERWLKIMDYYVEYMGGPEEIKNIYTNFLSSKSNGGVPTQFLIYFPRLVSF